MQIKVVSWNIWQSRQIPQVIEKLEQINADVIGLQEVTEVEGINSGQQIADALGYQHIYCQAFTTQDRIPNYRIGNSFITKLPIKDSNCRLLSTIDDYQKNPQTEPRSYLSLTVDIEGRPLNFANTHLGYSPDLTFTSSQKIQLKVLTALIPKSSYVLLGDFNSLPASEVVSTIEMQLHNTDPLKTEPTRFSREGDISQKDRIDYIFVSHDLNFSDFIILGSEASDHGLLEVTIEL